MQDVQGEFISGVLAEEELGTKLHVHLAEGCYAGRVLNPRSYDAVSRCDTAAGWSGVERPASWHAALVRCFSTVEGGASSLA